MRPIRLYAPALLITKDPRDYFMVLRFRDQIYKYLIGKMPNEVASEMKEEIRERARNESIPRSWATKHIRIINYCIGKATFESITSDLKDDDLMSLFASCCEEEIGIRSRVDAAGNPVPFRQYARPYASNNRPYGTEIHTDTETQMRASAALGLWYVDQMRAYGYGSSDIPEIVFSGGDYAFSRDDLSKETMDQHDFPTRMAVDSAYWFLRRDTVWRFFYNFIRGYVYMTKDIRRAAEVFYVTIEICNRMGLPT